MFLIAVAFLAIVLAIIMTVTLKIFNQVFRRYDDLNASVQENISAIRVVKAFVREDYENTKFSKASATLYKMFVKAESILTVNAPAMMVAVYFCIISVSWLGAHFIVGGTFPPVTDEPLQLHHVHADEPDDGLHGSGDDQHFLPASDGSVRFCRKPRTCTTLKTSGRGEGRQHRLQPCHLLL